MTISRTFRKQIELAFDLSEIRNICFDLEFPYDELPGDRLSAKINSLVSACLKQGKVEGLHAILVKERPNTDWVPLAEIEAIKMEELEPEASTGTTHVEGNMITGNISIGSISDVETLAIGHGAEVNINKAAETAEINQLFAPVLAKLESHPAEVTIKVEALQAEIAAEKPDDNKIANLVSDIADAAPDVVEMVTGLFTNSIISKAAGAATKFVIGRFNK